MVSSIFGEDCDLGLAIQHKMPLVKRVVPIDLLCGDFTNDLVRQSSF